MADKKHCSGCECDLDLNCFAWKNKAKGTMQRWCRNCQREANRIHYLNNTQVYKNRALDRNHRIAIENRQKIHNYLTNHPCIDCGNSDIRCLEFDHVRGMKVANISRLLANFAPWEVIEAEILKCETRCANCHRIKTGERSGWWRFLRLGRE